MDTAGLPAGIEEQKKSLGLVFQIAETVSGDLDTGVYYWEPLCYPAHGHGSWDENMGMLDENGKALMGFDVYRDFSPENMPYEDIDGYMESLYAVDESQLPPAGTNLILAMISAYKVPTIAGTRLRIRIDIPKSLHMQ